MKIKKQSGEWVNFDRQKLVRSLINSGANYELANAIVSEIESKIQHGATSKQIFRLAFQKLRTRSNSNAARYNLKKGIQLLGPAGFYFEKFIARIFELQGFLTKTNLIVEGNCVSHELDVVVQKDMHLAMIECKFHGSQETKTDVKVPMYILSRFNDLRNRDFNFFSSNQQFTKCWIVTNNKFTEDAVKFGVCSELNLLSWNYPEGNSLKDIITHYRVFPITCLTTITQAEKEILLLEDILTVYDFIHFGKSKTNLKLSQNRLKKVLNECHQLLNN